MEKCRVILKFRLDWTILTITLQESPRPFCVQERSQPFRTCAVPNKFRTRTQLRKIKPHFISLKFRVPKMEIRSSRHSHSAHLIVSLCMALSYEAWVRREFGVRFFPAGQLTVFHRGFSKRRPPASKQASHLLKIFLDTRLSFCLEMLAISFRLL